MSCTQLEQSVWRSIEQGDLESVKKYISDGIDLAIHDLDGNTMLMKSIMHQKLDITKFLISAGVDIDQLSFGLEEQTALHLALERKELSVAKLLLEAGADVEIYSSSHFYNSDGTAEMDLLLTSTLSLAIYSGDEEIIDLILEKVSDAQIQGNSRKDQPRPLIDAIGQHDIETVKKLLARGADPNLSDGDRTPLMEAAFFSLPSVVELLLEHPNINIYARDNGNWSALDFAVQLSRWDNARMLWEAGLDSKITRSPNRCAHGTWVRPFLKNRPRPRSEAAIASHGSCLYLFGGHGHVVENEIYYRDINLDLREVPLADFWKLDFSKVTFEDFSIRFKKANIAHNTLNGNTSPKNLLVEDLYVSCIEEDEDAEECSACVVGKLPYSKETGFSYFEVHIEDLPDDGTLAIGFVNEDYDSDSLPGWGEGSIALHSDDGQVFRDNRSMPWGRRFFRGDVVGAGIDFESQEVFFTLNGEFLGVAYFGLDPKTKAYYPSIGLTHAATSANVNFGATPFRFNLRMPVLYWTQLPFILDKPAFIDIHGMVAVGDQLMLLGDERNHLNSVFMFDTQSEKWSIASAPASTPKPTRVFKPKGVGMACIDGVIYTHKESFPDAFQTHTVSNNVYTCKTLVTDGLPLEKVRPQILGETDLTSDVLSRYPEISDPSIPDLEKLNASRTADIVKYAYQGKPGFQYQNRLCFASAVDLAIFDPKTLNLKVLPCSGYGPNLSDTTMAGLSDMIVSYGGWDNVRSRTDLAILDTKTLEWSRPVLSGIFPRCRQESSAVGMLISIDNPLFGYSLIDSLKSASNQMNTPGTDGSQNSGPIPKDGQIECFVIFGGWDGQRHLNDLDIFVPSPFLALKSNSWQAEASSATYITFDVCNPLTDEKVALNVEPCLISARSSVLHELLSECKPKDAFPVKANINHFKALLQFLYDDMALFRYSGQEARDFYSLVKEWAPEHADRVGQSLILDFPFAQSTWSSELDELFESSEHCDIELIFEGKSIKAHKEVLKRNEYFKRLLGGGLRVKSHFEPTGTPLNPTLKLHKSLLFVS